jgi:hypothetical protein
VFEANPPRDRAATRDALDRRARRSEVSVEAARLYLEAVRERCAIDVLALGEDGEAIASSGEGEVDANDLVREASRVVSGGADDGDVDLFAHAVRVGDRPLVLVSTGRRVDRLQVVVADLARILA